MDAQDALDPGDDLVRGRIDRLVQVDAARLDILVDGPIERRRTVRQRRVVVRADVQLVKVLFVFVCYDLLVFAVSCYANVLSVELSTLSKSGQS